MAQQRKTIRPDRRLHSEALRSFSRALEALAEGRRAEAILRAAEVSPLLIRAIMRGRKR